MPKFTLAISLSLICFFVLLSRSLAQGMGEVTFQLTRTVFRYGQFDRSPTRTSSNDNIKFFPHFFLRDLDSLKGHGDSIRMPIGSISGTYAVYDTFLTQSNFVAAGDLENDGFKDLVSSSYYDGYIAILHQSTTTHQLELVALWDVTQGGATNGISDVFIADMNGDCLNDIVAVDVLNGITAIFLQTNEYGVFTRIQLNAAARGAIGDLNQDGHTDLLWGAGNHVFVAYQTPMGFSDLQLFSVPPGSFDMMEEPAVGDVNGDRLSDLVAVDGYRNLLYVWESPQMQLRILNAPNNVSENVSLGDLDKDGILDIAVPGMGTDQVAVTWGRAFTTTMLSGIGNMKDVAIGDIGDDEDLELIATDQQYYHLAIWKFNGRNPILQIAAANVGPGQVIVDDLNGDGLNDVAYGLSGYTAPPHAPVTLHYQTGMGNTIPRFGQCIEWRRIYLPLVVR
ncbi:MAG: VCBS repeat-containing protein [Chloroflexi bacterium]|nr:VCBS repeat-containing protein [Chloroflexota bacterium]